MKKHLIKIIFGIVLLLAIFLRVYKVDTLISPYWEEVALGYDAFSISQTAKDHHGNVLPIVAFESFGDWKPSFYFYTIVPFIQLLGLELIAVRLPSILSGLFIVIGIAYLLKLIIPKSYLQAKPYLPLLALFISAISPWAIMFSRAAWEVNLATALLLWGVITFIRFTQNKSYRYLSLGTAIILLSLAMYTYHATRIIAPILGMMLVYLWFNNQAQSTKFISSFQRFIDKNTNILLIAFGSVLILTAPLLINMRNTTTNQRFKETSIFFNLDVIQESNQALESQPNIFGKIFYHRYLLFGREILSNYFDHFTVDFLFISGDSNPRHASQYFGQLYHIELIYILLGVYFVLSVLRKTKNDPYPRIHKNYLWLLIGWLLIGILPASISKTTPHSLRILPVLPVILVFITLGVSQCIDEITNLLTKWKLSFKHTHKVILVFIVLIYILELSVFWRYYTKIYPVTYSSEWQSGYQELVQIITQHNDGQTPIFITREQGRPAMYYWFYSKTDPRLVQAWDTQAKMDQGEYLQFETITFVNSLQEVTTYPSIIAGSPQQTESLIEKIQETGAYHIETLGEVPNKAGKIIWQVQAIKKL